MSTPEAINWQTLEADVVGKIHLLRSLWDVTNRSEMPPALKSRLWSDIILPNLNLLLEFSENVQEVDNTLAADEPPKQD